MVAQTSRGASPWLCLIVQALLAGLHAARFIDQQLTASDPSICHGGNTAPNPLRSDKPDICCLLGCTLAGQTTTLPQPATLPSVGTSSVRTAQLIQRLTLLRSRARSSAQQAPGSSLRLTSSSVSGVYARTVCVARCAASA